MLLNLQGHKNTGIPQKAKLSGKNPPEKDPVPKLTLLQCCGSESESEIIRIFWLDPNPNPKKKFEFGHCCRMKIFVKNQKSNT
jgi:hypothetical protein